MRILALRAKGRVLPHIHEAMVKAFAKLGMEVDNVPIPDQGDDFSLVEEKLKSDAQVVFTLNMGGDQNFLTHLREWQMKHRQIWIIWFVDDPEGYNFPQACEPSYTLAFCWDRGIREEMARACSNWGGYMHHLPLATNPEIFFPEENISHYPWRGIFVGVVSHPNKLFEEIIDLTPDLRIEVENLWKIYSQDFTRPLHDFLWGRMKQKIRQPEEELRSNWLVRLWIKAAIYLLAIKKRTELVSKVLNGRDGLFGDEAWLKFKKEIYQGQISYGEDLRQIYNRASFVLDIRPGQSRTGLTQRIFDAGACGTTVLTEWSPELEPIFDGPDEVFYYRSLAEAKQKRDWIISDMGEAKKKAKKLRERILRNHTYYSRARHILECFKKF